MFKLLGKLALLFTLIYSFAIADDNQSIVDENQSANLPKQKSIFLSYEELPKKVYVGEVFPIKIKAIIANKNYEDLSHEFGIYNQENIEILNQENKWQWFSDNIFYNTFYVKLNSTEVTLPPLTFNLVENDKIIESEVLGPPELNIIKLNSDKYFSHVIAKSLQVIKYKTTYFDDSRFIVVLEIEAEESNLASFTLKWVQRDGIDSFQDNLPLYKIYYYAIVPEYTKEFSFTYFDKTKDNFQKITLPIVVDEDKVSTQIDLNPKDSSWQLYKYGISGFFILLFTLLFFRRKKLIYIIFIMITLAFGLYSDLPLNNIKVETNTKIRILPTKNSTIFYTIDRPMYAEELAKKGEFIKILLPNGKIGWIKETNVIKD